MSSSSSSKRDFISISILLVLLLVLLFKDAQLNWNPFHKSSTPHSSLRLQKAIKHCNSRYSKPQRLDTSTREINPRISIYNNQTTFNSHSKLIKNAYILDGDGVLNNEKMDIFLKNGIVYDIVKSSSQNSISLQELLSPYEIVDAKSHIVTPGLVEMHSHIGICSQPELKGVNDMFELMSPVTPFTRVIDAFNIGDPAIKLNSFGGVTTSLVLPSANLISGEGYAFKHHVPESLSVEEMLVQYDPERLVPNSGDRLRWMKMACGENPKKRYVSRPEAPKSRMGLGYLFREYMYKAALLKEKQDEWCDHVQNNGEIPIESPIYPYEVDLEMLVGLLRGQVLSNAHCYETFDIETLLRHSKEFEFELNAVHHALDAYRIPQMLKNLPYNITVATFATLWGFKKEAYQASLFSPAILEQNGLNVVLTTDHPALPGHSLIYQAQVAHNYGLSKEKAFSSVSGQAAVGLGLDDRIGFLRKGYDADVVIWDKHPLDAGATPLKVFIDGQNILDLKIEDSTDEILQSPDSRISIIDDKVHDLIPMDSDTFLIKGIKKSLVRNIILPNCKKEYELLIENGRIKSLDESCKQYLKDDTFIPTISLQNGYLLPGIVALTTKHGLAEIESELTTGDGDARETIHMDFTKPENLLRAKDGLHFQSDHLLRAFHSGITQVITPPFKTEGHLFITGLSTSIYTNGQTLEDGVIKKEVALHITIGDMGKQPNLPTISSQISQLKRLLMDNSDQNNVYGQIARSELTLAVHANNKDVLMHLISLKREIGFKKMVIIGGLEAHLVVEDLYKENIPVLLNSWRCQRKYWDERRCLTGMGYEEHILSNLTSNGIKVGLGYPEDQDVRIAFDYAASASGTVGLTEEQIIDMISYNVNEMFDIDIKEENSFIVMEGSPLKYSSRLVMIVQNGISKVQTYPDPELRL